VNEKPCAVDNVPLSHKPVSEVAVWPIAARLIQRMESPRSIVCVAGSKRKLRNLTSAVKATAGAEGARSSSAKATTIGAAAATPADTRMPSR